MNKQRFTGTWCGQRRTIGNQVTVIWEVESSAAMFEGCWKTESVFLEVCEGADVTKYSSVNHSNLNTNHKTNFFVVVVVYEETERFYVELCI